MQVCLVWVILAIYSTCNMFVRSVNEIMLVMTKDAILFLRKPKVGESNFERVSREPNI